MTGPVLLLLAPVMLAALAAAAWGWGRAFLGACRMEEGSGLAYPVAVGLAFLSALGGWLNLLGAAYTPILWLLLGGGWGFVAWRARAAAASAWRDIPASERLFGAVIAALAICLSLAFVPAGVLNPFDDFPQYLVRPVRMLQAGTLGGNPFDALGLESLGPLSFLQGFTLLAAGPQALLLVDAVLCAALALALALRIGRDLGAGPAAALAALATLLLIHPQQVNISAVYAIVVFALALLLAAQPLLRAEIGEDQAWRAAVPPGLLAGALLAVKSTAFFFVCIAALLLGSALVARRGPRSALRIAAGAALGALLLLLPWLLVHAAKYARMRGGGETRPFAGAVSSPADLFSSEALLWGETPMTYGVLALLVLAVALGAAAAVASRRDEERHALVVPVILCAAAALNFFLNTVLHDVRHTVRYGIPVLIAGAALAVLLAGRLAAPWGRRGAAALAGAAVLALAAGFAGTISSRASAALKHRTPYAFPPDTLAQYARYTDLALREDTARWVRRAQARVPAGERMAAMTGQPGHLLFARNPVLVIYDISTSWPWLDIPQKAGAAEMRALLRSLGVRYVLWQASGPGVKPEDQITPYLDAEFGLFREGARRALWLRRSLAALAAEGTVVYEESGLLVIDAGK